MTQYVLVKATQSCDVLKPVSELNEPFYEKIAAKIFPSSLYSEIYLIDVEGDDIDRLFLDAQKAIANHEAFESTRLNKVISRVLGVSDEMVFWYGSDYEDLDCVGDSTALSELIVKVLETSNCEAYLRYKNHQY